MPVATPGSSESPAETSASLRRLLMPCVLLLAVVAAYWNSMRAPFLFDDAAAVVNNPTIRHLASLDVLNPPDNGSTTSGRPLVNLSFAINYAISGDRVWSYHALNLAIHALAALTLMGIVRRTLCGPKLRERFGSSAPWLAFFAALLWALHPLQTESVTCIAQRTESLSALFYLLTLYAFIRAIDEGSSRARWFVLSIASFLVGMGCKEILATAPVLVLLYDRTFLAGTFVAAWRQRRAYYVALAAMWLLLVCLVLSRGGSRGVAAGFGLGVSSWNYLLTQCDALVIYLKLSLWPHPLVLDYGTVVVRSVGEVWWQGTVIIALLVATIWALVRRPVIGFFGAWFFVILAPSSSVIPLVGQTIAEHRMYLPLAAIVVLVLAAVSQRLGQRALIATGAVLALAAAVFTTKRNAEYHDEWSLWQDALAWNPNNARAQNNLGTLLYNQGKLDDALARYRESLRLDPDVAQTQYNYALALMTARRTSEALTPLTEAIRIQPDFFDALLNLGIALTKLGRPREALTQLDAALRVDQLSAEARYRRGVALAELGSFREAIDNYAQAVRLDPSHAKSHIDWGLALFQTRAIAEAITHFETALRLQPKLAEAHFNLGIALAESGKQREALDHLRTAARTDPESAEIHSALALALANSDLFPEAIEHYEAALRIEPRAADIHFNLAIALLQMRRERDATAHLEETLHLDPNHAGARDVLPKLRGQPPNARSQP